METPAAPLRARLPKATSIVVKKSALQGTSTFGNAAAIVAPPASVKGKIASLLQEIHGQYQREWAVKLNGDETGYGDHAFE
jgi:hypothetical protein